MTASPYSGESFSGATSRAAARPTSAIGRGRVHHRLGRVVEEGGLPVPGEDVVAVGDVRRDAEEHEHDEEAPGGAFRADHVDATAPAEEPGRREHGREEEA